MEAFSLYELSEQLSQERMGRRLLTQYPVLLNTSMAGCSVALPEVSSFFPYQGVVFSFSKQRV